MTCAAKFHDELSAAALIDVALTTMLATRMCWRRLIA